MAVALVIFARWSPLRCVAAALLFGAAGAIGPSLQSIGITQGYYFFNAAPYILTLVIMIATSSAKHSAARHARRIHRWRNERRAMNGLGGLNKSPNGVVVGVVQLQLPVVVTRDDLAAQTQAHRRDDGQGAPQHGDDGSRRFPRIFAARPVDGHEPRDHVLARRAGDRRVQAGLPRQRDLGLLLHHGVQPARQSLQFRRGHRRHGRAEALLSQDASLDAGGAVGARRHRHSRHATGRRAQSSRSSSATTACFRRWRANAPTRAPKS